VRVTLCVDALEPHPGGIGRYTWELCNGLAARADIRPLQFYRQGTLVDEPARLLRGEHVGLPRRRLTRWFRARQTRRALASNLVHAPNYFLPDAAETGVVTIHDLSVFRYPETHPVQRVQEFERLFSSSLQRAAHVITDTETIRGELIDDYSVAPEMITAVPLGVDARFRPMRCAELASGLQRFGLTAGHYGLTVSALEPRKKISELIAAWKRLPRALRDQYPLVVAGGSGWLNDELHEQIRQGVSGGWLRHLGFVAEDDLPLLYAGAVLFVYPSIYEGFGLPPVEAMASGVPVLVADRSCLPEVCGDAARYIDPDDEAGFASAIEESLSNELWRSQAIRRGLARAAQFTWSRCVEDTVAVYRRAEAG
jgi:glycosyltransferase involved in cell wall biosynthesis